ncbi:MAG: UbiA family prenyltransferase [Desulforhopalus sp.]
MIRRVEIAKVPLCLLIGCSALFGYILADPHIALKALLTGIGVFVLATGAASMNSMQEYRLDGEMERTKNRPVVLGLLTVRQAAMQSIILMFIGVLLLAGATKSLMPVIMSILALALYNGVYTPLKKRTVLAIIPGALCGALPPYIGWLAGGGEAGSYTAALLVVLFVLWQVPHFGLIMLVFKEDYESSNRPNLLRLLSESKLKRILVTWVGALVAVMLLFLTLQPYLGSFIRTLIVLNCCLLLAVFIYYFSIRKNNNYRFLFIILNLALFFHMLFLAIGRLIVMR